MQDRWKVSASTSGPIWEVLEDRWNQVHDLEDDLSRADKHYDDVAHFSSSPATQEAKAIVSAIAECVHELEKISMQKFDKLVNMEKNFIQKYGHPGDYADKYRREIFPR